MKKIVCSLLLFLAVNVQAQSPAKAFFFELGGPGIASVNYDMRFTKSESGFGGRVGVGGFSLSDGSEKFGVVFVPVGVNYLIGKDSRNYFELGGGVTFVSSSDSYSNENFNSTFGHLNFGYRLQPAKGGFFFRATMNPIFGKGFFLPAYGGLSFGYKF